MTTAATFGLKLKELRESQGLSQSELARKTGIPQRTISRYEAGETDPSWSYALKLAEALQVDCRAFQPSESPS